jgi:DNA polymerase III alpha subunit (gram-positive type)
MLALVFDTETTGLLNNRTLPLDKQPEIIEFNSVLVDLKTGDRLSEIDELIKPIRAIPEDITKKNNITNDMVAERPPFPHFADLIQRTLETAPLVISHNVSFDTEMVEVEYQRLQRAIRWPRVLCTVEQTVWMTGYRLSLQDLHKQLFAEGFTGAHRAKADVDALVKCCIELFCRGDL